MDEETFIVEESGLFQSPGFTVGAMGISEKMGKLCVIRKLDISSKKRIPLNVLEFWNIFDCPNIFFERQIPFDGVSIEAITWKSNVVFCACTDGSAYLVSPFLAEKRRVQVCPSALWCCASSLHTPEVFFGSDSGSVFGVSIDEDGKPVTRQVLYIGVDRRVLSLACTFKNNAVNIAVGTVDRIEIHTVVGNGSAPKVAIYIDIPRQHIRKATIVWALQFLSNGVLVSGDSQGKVTFWNANNGASYKSIQSHQADILCLSVGSNDCIYASGVEHRIQVIAGLTGGEKQFDWSTVGQRLIHEIDVRSLVEYGPWLISGGAEHFLTISNSFISYRTPAISNCSVASEVDYLALGYPRYVEVWQRGKANFTKQLQHGKGALVKLPRNVIRLFPSKSKIVCSSLISQKAKFVAIAGDESLTIYGVSSLTSKNNRNRKKNNDKDPAVVLATVPDVSVTAMCENSDVLYYAFEDFTLARWDSKIKNHNSIVVANGAGVLRTMTVSKDNNVVVALNCRSQLIVVENMASTESGEKFNSTAVFRSINLNSPPIDCRFLSNNMVVVLSANHIFTLTCIDLNSGSVVGTPTSASSLFPPKDVNSKVKDFVTGISDVVDGGIAVTASNGAYAILSELSEHEKLVRYEAVQSKYRGKSAAVPVLLGSSKLHLATAKPSTPTQTPFKMVRYDRA
ncbi:hypothetical protein L596_007215 [Steinernema carpocapsae]|uniref:Uncharacterized protein n=1 Tax=Steinernema carpocapsae TaxID=34508 RepID=A0A4U5P901_STECR|nr:hypothetical protein L596_007215 [Steinernema carpocapsae]